jgi:hypothetical protein
MKIKHIAVMLVVIGCFTGVASYSNNTPASAYFIRMDSTATTVSKNLGDSIAPRESLDYHWYQVFIPSPLYASDGRLRVATKTDGALDVKIYIYRWVNNSDISLPQGSRVVSQGNTTVDSVTDANHTSCYLVLIARNSGKGTYTASFDFFLAALKNDADSNEIPWEAQKIAIDADYPDTSFTGHLGYYSFRSTIDSECIDRDDWYKIILPSDGLLSVSSHTSDGNLDCSLSIYCPTDYESLPNIRDDCFGSSGDAKSDSLAKPLCRQAVYLLVSRKSGVGSYAVKARFSPADLDTDMEYNNIPNAANFFPYDSIRTGHLGYYRSDPGYDDFDWHYFELPSAMILKISSVTCGDLNCELRFYDTISSGGKFSSLPAGTPYIGSKGNLSRDSLTVQIIKPGTYYLLVMKKSGAGSYSLSAGITIPTALVDSKTVPESCAHRLIPVTASPSVTLMGYSLLGRKIFTKDYSNPSGAASLSGQMPRCAPGWYIGMTASRGKSHIFRYAESFLDFMGK